jgi:hypothetical protein
MKSKKQFGALDEVMCDDVSHQSPINSAVGTLSKLFVMYNSGVNTRNVDVTVASDEQVELQNGHIMKATDVGALGFDTS